MKQVPIQFIRLRYDQEHPAKKGCRVDSKTQSLASLYLASKQDRTNGPGGGVQSDDGINAATEKIILALESSRKSAEELGENIGRSLNNNDIPKSCMQLFPSQRPEDISPLGILDAVKQLRRIRMITRPVSEEVRQALRDLDSVLSIVVFMLCVTIFGWYIMYLHLSSF
jgi:hypothetical protein